jgi:flavin reductase (DIM6/NTAB) family NADH-FMN oxidoreductase RutF
VSVKGQENGMTDEVADFMQTISTGVYVIGVCDGKRTNAFTASSVVPISFKPVMVAVGVGIHHASRPMLRAGPAFTINVLKHDQIDVASHFGTVSGRELNKLTGVRWRPGLSGAPILTDALAYIECELASIVAAGDHELALGRVVDGALLASAGQPLLYRDTHNLDGAHELYPPQLRDTVGAHPFTVRC